MLALLLGFALALLFVPTALAKSVVVDVSQHPTLGKILTDSEGRTLYHFTRDTPNVSSACYGQCATTWPPLLIDEGNPVRAILGRVMDSLREQTPDIHVVITPLMAFAQTLEYDAKWLLAADVYHSVLAHLHPVEDADASIAAHLRLGSCYRNLHDVPAAAAAFEAASNVATAVGDIVGVLRARVGEARIAILRGNLPRAEEILDDSRPARRLYVGLNADEAPLAANLLGCLDPVGEIVGQQDELKRLPLFLSHRARRCFTGLPPAFLTNAIRHLFTLSGVTSASLTASIFAAQASRPPLT